MRGGHSFVHKDGPVKEGETWYTFVIDFYGDRPGHYWYAKGKTQDAAKAKIRRGRGIMYIWEARESTPHELAMIHKANGWPEPTPAKLFKICERGTNDLVCGLQDLRPGHPQLMMLVPSQGDKTWDEMAVGEVLSCRAGARGFKGDDKGGRTEYYDVVRTE